VGLDLGASGGNLLFAIGEPSSLEVGGLAAGPEGLRLVALPSADEILVAGGLQQSRTITAHSTSTQDVSVEPPFDPPPSPGQPWHVREDRLRGSAQGVAGRFVWDSRDAGGGSVLIRAL